MEILEIGQAIREDDETVVEGVNRVDDKDKRKGMICVTSEEEMDLDMVEIVQVYKEKGVTGLEEILEHTRMDLGKRQKVEDMIARHKN
jgi:IS4 transposase